MDRKIVSPSDVVFFRNLMLQHTNILAGIGGQAPLARWMETSSTEPIELQYADPKKRAIALIKLNLITATTPFNCSLYCKTQTSPGLFQSVPETVC